MVSFSGLVSFGNSPLKHNEGRRIWLNITIFKNCVPLNGNYVIQVWIIEPLAWLRSLSKKKRANSCIHRSANTNIVTLFAENICNGKNIWNNHNAELHILLKNHNFLSKLLVICICVLLKVITKSTKGHPNIDIEIFSQAWIQLLLLWFLCYYIIQHVKIFWNTFI